MSQHASSTSECLPHQQPCSLCHSPLKPIQVDLEEQLWICSRIKNLDCSFPFNASVELSNYLTRNALLLTYEKEQSPSTSTKSTASTADPRSTATPSVATSSPSSASALFHSSYQKNSSSSATPTRSASQALALSLKRKPDTQLDSTTRRPQPSTPLMRHHLQPSPNHTPSTTTSVDSSIASASSTSEFEASFDQFFQDDRADELDEEFHRPQPVETEIIWD